MPRIRPSARPPARPPRDLALDEDLPRELSFETDERAARIGDRLTPEEIRNALPRARALEAGAGIRPGHVTADDLSPETLLDEDYSRTPSARSRRRPLDTILRVVDEGEIGEGGGLDEAELARAAPVGMALPRRSPERRS